MERYGKEWERIVASERVLERQYLNTLYRGHSIQPEENSIEQQLSEGNEQYNEVTRGNVDLHECI